MHTGVSRFTDRNSILRQERRDPGIDCAPARPARLGLAGEVILGLQVPAWKIPAMAAIDSECCAAGQNPALTLSVACGAVTGVDRAHGRAIPSRDQIVLMSNDGAPCVS